MKGMEIGAGERPPPSERAERLLLLGASLWLASWVVLNAWVCDDGYISMRTADAFLRGEGLVWNPGARVQAYTHPLWLAFLIALRGVGSSAYLALLLPGLLGTAATLVGLRMAAPSPRALFPIVIALGVSPAFVQFATSGLEGPATHALLVAFFLLFSRSAPLRQLALVAALLMLNRMDTLLLVAPALLVAAREQLQRPGRTKALMALTVGVLPFALWALFALVYYGTPFPNTAYAKLAHGLPRADLLGQGVSYLLTSISFDPLGALLAILGLGFGLRDRSRLGLTLAAGALLYLAYIVWVGGDFMAGRFTTPVLVLGAFSLAASPRWASWMNRRSALAAAAILPLVVGALPAHHVATPLRESMSLQVPEGPLPLHSRHWVTVEQAFYWEATALAEVIRRDDDPPYHRWAEEGSRLGEAGGVRVVRNIGFAGFRAAGGAHLVDPYALADPFLARLPAFRNIDWHVGHYRRAIPAGYEASLRDGVCRMDDAELCALFDDVRLVTRAPIFAPGRGAAILRLLRFRPSPSLARDRLLGERVLAPQRPLRPVPFVDSGVEIHLDAPTDSPFAAEVEPCHRYTVVFLQGEVEVHREDAMAEPIPGSCLLRAPSEGEVHDRVHILTLTRPGPYAYRGPFEPFDAP